MTIPPFDSGWHREALAAVQDTNDTDGVLFVAASAEEDGKHFVYLRCNEAQARDLIVMLSQTLADRSKAEADEALSDFEGAASEVPAGR